MPVPGRLASMAADRAAALLRIRWLARTPVWLYRARLGIVFGSRFVMLEHTGRKTGARRYAVLEVIGRPALGRYLVVSGFGGRAQWYRNIRANPQVRLYTRSRTPIPATARQLASQDAAAALNAYARRHPRAWAAMKPVLNSTLGGTKNEPR